MKDLRNYCLVTAAYWAFTLTDGALRMLVLLHFYKLGYSPIQIAFLFLFYEFFGIVTNLLGGWIGSRLGLNFTLWGGLGLQVLALGMLALLSPEWSETVSVAYVMTAQALSGIAKDLTKMSSKSAIKLLVPEDASGTLFKWVALLTGSKNALKGVGFFLGGLLLSSLGFVPALLTMAGALFVILAATMLSLSWGIGKTKAKVKFTQLFSKSSEINVLSAARFFLFGARDVWFVVGLPIFLQVTLGWGFTEVGGFLALWVIGYGVVQSIAPGLLRRRWKGQAPQGSALLEWAIILAAVTASIALGLQTGLSPTLVIVSGLTLFAIAFAINSAVHSYLILAYTEGDKVALNVGFYYMANAGGRLAGTVLSGLLFQVYGLIGCLWASVAFVLAAGLLARWLPHSPEPKLIPLGAVAGDDG
jgi:predicted MFS family arabinose efflux permease